MHEYQYPNEHSENNLTTSGLIFYLSLSVQKDVTFIMHRSVALWRTWYTEPMPNIGLMLVKGNKRNYAMFEKAWADYLVSLSAYITYESTRMRNYHYLYVCTCA
jgi:hypothetical protein